MKFIVFLLLLFLVSCNNGSVSESTVVNNYDIDLDTCNSIVYRDSLAYDIFSLENKADYMLSGIDKMSITPSGIYIMDTKYLPNLYVFDTKGNALSKIGKQGHSKSEYVRINNFSTNEKGDTVAILDDFGKVIKFYDKTGSFIRSYTFENECGWNECLLLDNCVYAYSYNHIGPSVITKYSADFSEKQEIGIWDSNLIQGLCGHYSNMQYSKKYICVLDFYNSRFYLVDRYDNDKIISISLISKNIISPLKEKFDYEIYHDHVAEYWLTNDEIICSIYYKKQLATYSISLSSMSISKISSKGMRPHYMSKDDSFFYSYFTTSSILNLKKYNISDSVFNKAIEPYFDSLSEFDNYYIVKGVW